MFWGVLPGAKQGFARCERPFWDSRSGGPKTPFALSLKHFWAFWLFSHLYQATGAAILASQKLSRDSGETIFAPMSHRALWAQKCPVKWSVFTCSLACSKALVSLGSHLRTLALKTENFSKKFGRFSKTQFIRTRRIVANPEKSDLVNFRGPD